MQSKEVKKWQDEEALKRYQMIAPLLDEELDCVAAGKGTPAPDEEKPKNQTNPFL